MTSVYFSMGVSLSRRRCIAAPRRHDKRRRAPFAAGVVARLARIFSHYWVHRGGESAKIVVLQPFISDSRSAPMPTECTRISLGLNPLKDARW